MNAQEHLDYLAERTASAPVGSLRAAMYSREGVEATDFAIRRGLQAWAVERSGWPVVQRVIVFGRSRSDALRRASAPARLGEQIYGDVDTAAVIASGWDEPFAWPENFS